MTEPIPVEVPVDRPLEEMEEMVARLNAELTDLRTTVLARLSTRPTGTIEPTLLGTAPAGALLAQGQTLNRADYPALWAWAQSNGRVITGLFGAGNGTTTFTMPDLRGRVILGAGTLGGDTYVVGGTGGASTVTLTTSNMPAHDHNVGGSGSTGSSGSHSHGGSVGSAGSHSHGGSVGSGGDHGGHSSGTSNVTQSGSGVTLPSFYNAGSGSHSHSISTDSGGSHTHSITTDTEASHTHTVSLSITESSVGGGTAHENRQPYLALNYLIYT